MNIKNDYVDVSYYKLEEVLSNLQEIYQRHGYANSIEILMCPQNKSEDGNFFLTCLNSISIHLNKLSITNSNNNEILINWNAFTQYDSLKIFSLLFEFTIKKQLHQTNSKSDENTDGFNERLICGPFKDLLEILSRLSIRSLEFVKHFVEFNMFQVFVMLFQNQTLVEFLFESQFLILIRLLNIFYQICLYLVYFERTDNVIVRQVTSYLVDNLDILTRAKDLLERLSIEDRRPGMQYKPLLRLYLFSLFYLQRVIRQDL